MYMYDRLLTLHGFYVSGIFPETA